MLFIQVKVHLNQQNTPTIWQVELVIVSTWSEFLYLFLYPFLESDCGNLFQIPQKSVFWTKKKFTFYIRQDSEADA